MARRDLFNDDERRRLFGLPESEAEIIRHYTLTPADLEYAADRHGAHNRLGFAVQLCLLRHPGFGLRSGEPVPEALLDYLAHQVGVPAAAFRDYSRRAQTGLITQARLLPTSAFARSPAPTCRLRWIAPRGPPGRPTRARRSPVRSSMACVRPSSSCPRPTRSSGQASPGAPGLEGEQPRHLSQC